MPTSLIAYQIHKDKNLFHSRQLHKFPDAKQFSEDYAKLAVSSVLRAPSTGNCELQDEDSDVMDFATVCENVSYWNQ